MQLAQNKAMGEGSPSGPSPWSRPKTDVEQAARSPPANLQDCYAAVFRARLLSTLLHRPSSVATKPQPQTQYAWTHEEALHRHLLHTLVLNADPTYVCAPSARSGWIHPQTHSPNRLSRSKPATRSDRNLSDTPARADTVLDRNQEFKHPLSPLHRQEPVPTLSSRSAALDNRRRGHKPAPEPQRSKTRMDADFGET